MDTVWFSSTNEALVCVIKTLSLALQRLACLHLKKITELWRWRYLLIDEDYAKNSVREQTTVIIQ